MNHQVHSFSLAESASLVPFTIFIVGYVVLSAISSRTYRPLPWYCYLCWILGVLCLLASVVGPIASRSHTDFTAHMIVHLLLGMLAPLLFTLAAPMTLILRTLGVNQARLLTRVLRSGLFQFLHNPLTAAVLNMGGLWVLYTTDLYSLMHQHHILHVLVHVHVFLAGYLFTSSMLLIDPAPHRASFQYRTLVLLAALAGHGILSKHLYAHPPAGVPAAQAEFGSMLMYYGGDIIDAILIFLLFTEWYRASRPRHRLRTLTAE